MVERGSSSSSEDKFDSLFMLAVLDYRADLSHFAAENLHHRHSYALKFFGFVASLFLSGRPFTLPINLFFRISHAIF